LVVIQSEAWDPFQLPSWLTVRDFASRFCL
jgi:hypothetical protein